MSLLKKKPLFGIGITPGLIMRNYELSLTTVLAGVSAGVGEKLKGEKDIKYTGL